jgi:hypothetical protein
MVFSNASYCNPIHIISLKKSLCRSGVSNSQPWRCKFNTLPHGHGICSIMVISNASYCNSIHTYSLNKVSGEWRSRTHDPADARQTRYHTAMIAHESLWLPMVHTVNRSCYGLSKQKSREGVIDWYTNKNKIKKIKSENRDWIAHRIYDRKWYFLCLICWTQALCLNWNTGYMDFS